MYINKKKYFGLTKEIKELKAEVNKLKNLSNKVVLKNYRDEDGERCNVIYRYEYNHLVNKVDDNKKTASQQINSLKNIIKFGNGVFVEYDYNDIDNSNGRIFIYFCDKYHMISRKIEIKDISDEYIIKGYKYISDGEYRLYGSRKHQQEISKYFDIIEITINAINNEAIWNAMRSVIPSVKVSYYTVTSTLFSTMLKECKDVE